MNNGPLLIFGIFFALAASWLAIVFANMVQQEGAGATQPYFSEMTGSADPRPKPGMAVQGSRVYQDLGCAYCHTQQVRGADAGADLALGWGSRQSVSRDYIREQPVMLGSMRVGPDLRNVGERLPDADWHFLHLYTPAITRRDDQTDRRSTMPPHAFLFETRRIVGQRSLDALNLPPGFAPPEGYEVVPTRRARALVSYLLNLRTPYELPEAPSVQEEE